MKEKTEYPKMNERKNITFKNEWKNTKTWQVEKKHPNWMKRTKNKKEQKNNHKIHKNGEKLNKHKYIKQQIRQIRALKMNMEQNRTLN